MPVIAHGTWMPDPEESFINSGKLFIWLETRSINTDYPNIPENLGKLFPYACPLKYIYKHLRQMDIKTSSGKNTFEKTFIKFLLPTIDGKPIPSLEVKKYTGREKDIVLSDWAIPGVKLDISEALTLLSSLKDFIEDPEDLLIGRDLFFWSALYSYVDSTIRAEQFLPDLVKGDKGEYYALWEFAGNLAAKNGILSDFTKAMPGICKSTIPNCDGASLVEHFVSVALNSSINKFPTSKILEIILRAFSGNLEADFIQALLNSEMQPIQFSRDPKVFYKRVKLWRHGHSETRSLPLRLCFKLEEPKAPGLPWLLRFLLQGKDDPSLVLLADKIWENSKRQKNSIDILCQNPREVLLGSLGKASEIYPPLLKSLEQRKPHQWEMSVEEAYGFLKNGAGLLEESGFGVLVPAWWSRSGTKRVGIKIKLGSKDKMPTIDNGIMGFDAIVDYDVSLAVGEEDLSLDEWEGLVDLKVPLVNIKGQWVEVRKDEISDLLDSWRRRRERSRGRMRLFDAINIASGNVDEEELIEGIDMEGWFQDLFERLKEPDAFDVLEQPDDFCGKLRDYQRRGMSWMMYLEKWGLNGCLADDMGLGKTIQVLSLLLKEREERLSAGPTLLICPTSVVRNWQREAEHFAPTLSIIVHHGQQRLKGDAFKEHALGSDMVITSFSIARRDSKEFKNVRWKRIVIDEAQNIKNPKSQQTKAIKSLPSETRIALTGTPVENRLAELWSIMDFLNPGYLGSLNSFRANFELPIQKYNENKPLEKLQKLVKPFVLRRVKTDPRIIRDLPEKQETKVFCPLTREQASLYEAVVKDTLQKLESSGGMERRGLILASLMRLKQVCNHPTQFLQDRSALDGRSGKLTRLREMLYEVVAEGDSALIFTQFREMGELLRIYLDKSFDAEAMFLHGGVPMKARDEMVTRFQEGQGSKLFILSLRAGGVGLNLTRANHVFHFDHWWNPAVENQATDRAFRIGQKKNVQVFKYICQGTLEERIDELIQKKQALADTIIGSDEGWLTEMDNRQISQLITLSRRTALE